MYPHTPTSPRQHHNHAHRLGMTVFASLIASVGLVAGGCSDDVAAASCGANLIFGDLVFTEVLADPSGTDKGQEWFELYNATSADINLDGVKVTFSRADGSNAHTYKMPSTTIASGDYLVLGNAEDAVKPPHMDIGYGTTLGDMTQGGGKLSLRCGKTTVDEVEFGEAESGVAIQLSATTLDASANDDPNNWCAAKLDNATTDENLYQEFKGSPGSANAACAIPGKCLENGDFRDIVEPACGDVWISEIMSDAKAVGDGDGEWFEVYVSGSIDLNGLQFGKSAGDIFGSVDLPQCVSVSAGSWIVFGHTTDLKKAGGLPKVDYVFTDSLVHSSGGTLWIGVDGTTLDAVAYPKPTPGVAAAADSEGVVVAGGGDSGEECSVARSWCEAIVAYGAGDIGSPGAANPPCPCQADAGMCCLPDGSTRPVAAPVAGDLIINEVMPNPAGEEKVREWIELYATSAIDLNGLELGKVKDAVLLPGEFTLTQAACLPVAAGGFVVLARSANADENDGLPAGTVIFDKPTSLSNTKGNGVWIAHSGKLIDQTSWGSAADGFSWALDPNEDGLWCDARPEDNYGSENHGTPGEENPSCP